MIVQRQNQFRATNGNRNLGVTNLYNRLNGVAYLPERSSRCVTFRYLEMMFTDDDSMIVFRHEWDNLAA